MNKSQVRKWSAIDLYALYANSNSSDWNKAMAECVAKKDVTRLQKLLYGIQVGMDNIVKNKMASDKIHSFFIRLQRSLENTAKIVFRSLYPSPLDDPQRASQIKKTQPKEFEKWLKIKRKRDQELEKWRKGASF